MSQAAGPFNEAIEAKLLADGPLVAYLGGNYVLSAVLAQDVDLADFIILGSDDSLPWLRFNGPTPGTPREGELVGLMIDGWSKIRRANGDLVLGKARVLAIAGHIARVLNHQPLTLPSYGVGITGRAELVNTGRDPGLTLMRCQMRYEGYVTRTSP